MPNEIRTWKINEDTEHIVGNLIVRGALCPCDGFQSVRATAIQNSNGDWDDIHPVLIHKSNVVEIK